MIDENGRHDRKDGGDTNHFELLERYDWSIQAIFQEAEKFLGSTGEEEMAAALCLRRDLASLLATPSLRDKVLGEMKKYFDHDVLTFRRGVIGILECVKDDLDDYLAGRALDKGEFSRRVDLVRKNWEMYRLAVEDIFLRSRAPAGSYSLEQDRGMDRGENIKRLLEAIVSHVSEFCGRGFGKFETEFNPDLEELKKLKIVTPHGTIFNFLQNCIANAVDYSVRATKFKLMVQVSGSDLLFEFLDNGVGIDEDTRNSIFGKGFTTKGKTHGLGLANAPERFAELGGAVDVKSKPSDRPGGDWATKFILRIPLVK